MKVELYNKLVKVISDAVASASENDGQGVLNSDILAAAAGLYAFSCRVCSFNGSQVLEFLAQTWNNLDDFHVSQGKPSMGRLTLQPPEPSDEVLEGPSEEE